VYSGSRQNKAGIYGAAVSAAHPNGGWDPKPTAPAANALELPLCVVGNYERSSGRLDGVLGLAA